MVITARSPRITIETSHLWIAVVAVLLLAFVIGFVMHHGRRKDGSMFMPSTHHSNNGPIPHRSGTLQEQQFISVPDTLTPQKMSLPQVIPTKVEEVHRITEALLEDCGFFPTKPYPPRMFVGPFGEILRVAFTDDDGLRLDYADDYALAQNNRFQVFGSYPGTLGQRMLSIIYEDILEYAEGMLELL